MGASHDFFLMTSESNLVLWTLFTKDWNLKVSNTDRLESIMGMGLT